MTCGCNPITCHICCGRIPKRVVVAIMLHLALQNSYNLRVVLNVAIVEMVPPPPERIRNLTERACPNYDHIIEPRKGGGKFLWPPQTKSLVLYSFFIGYTISQVPGGWLADKYGGRHVLGISILLSALSTVVFPALTEYGGYIAAVVLRGILGIVQGPVLPAISKFVSTWIPSRERTLLGGISYGGSNLGTILGNIITGHLINYFDGWPAAFYFWTAVSCVYLGMHLLYLFSFPATDPFIDQDELEYILKDIVIKRKETKTPWKAIMLNMPFWANVSAQFGHNYIFYTLCTYLPTYMREILQYDIAENGVFSALPFCALWITSLILSCTVNHLIQLNCITPHTFGKVFGGLSNMASAALALAAIYVGCRREMCIMLYMLSMVVKAFYYVTLPVNINELSKNHSGTMYAICNLISTFSGIIGNAIIGGITEHQKLSEWRLAFWITFIISVVTSVVYIIWFSSERQAFDYEDHEDRPDETT